MTVFGKAISLTQQESNRACTKEVVECMGLRGRANKAPGPPTGHLMRAFEVSVALLAPAIVEAQKKIVERGDGAFFVFGMTGLVAR